MDGQGIRRVTRAVDRYSSMQALANVFACQFDNKFLHSAVRLKGPQMMYQSVNIGIGEMKKSRNESFHHTPLKPRLSTKAVMEQANEKCGELLSADPMLAGDGGGEMEKRVGPRGGSIEREIA